MESDYINENESLPVGTYKKIMSGIEFMQSYLEESDIFEPESASFKSFLIQSFCFLYSDFHYLSLKSIDVDAEIVKTSQILQILPVSSEKISKLFDNMSKEEINKFWLKFFALFKSQNGNGIKSTFKTSLDDKISFFKDIKSTFNYIDSEIPTSPAEKLSSWKQPLFNFALEETTLFNTDEELRNYIDIEKFIIDLKHVVSTYNNIKNPPHQQNNPEHAKHVDFFCNLITLAKTVSQYQNNLNVINSLLLGENNFKMLSSDIDFSENMNYIKRYNDFLRTLKSKVCSTKEA